MESWFSKQNRNARDRKGIHCWVSKRVECSLIIWNSVVFFVSLDFEHSGLHVSLGLPLGGYLKAEQSNTRRAGELVICVAALAAIFISTVPASSDTLESALIQAYQNNPALNSQRAATRAIDEGVPQALSGYRPRVTVTGIAGEQTSSTTTKQVTAGVGTWSTLAGYNSPAQLGGSITQTLYNGFQTANRTRQAESAVLAARVRDSWAGVRTPDGR
jgi:hypothetical protein